MAAVLDRFYGTGRRKTSIARVWIKPGAGRIVVNKRAFEDYFPRETLRMIIAQPLAITNTVGQFDLLVTVKGGGPTGQAGAVETPVGNLPRPGDLNTEGLDIAPEVLGQLLAMDREGWKAEMASIAEYLEEFGERTPAALKAERAKIAAQLA